MHANSQTGAAQTGVQTAAQTGSSHAHVHRSASAPGTIRAARAAGAAAVPFNEAVARNEPIDAALVATNPSAMPDKIAPSDEAMIEMTARHTPHDGS